MAIPERYLEIARNHLLLQSGELPCAAEIPDPVNLNVQALYNQWLFAKCYTETRRFSAVAFTQFSPETLDLVGVEKDLGRAIYYMRDDGNEDSLMGTLVINPRISNLGGEYIYLDGCGSIMHRKVSMVMKRPKYLDLTGYLWKPGMSKPESIFKKLSLFDAASTHHEIKHLDGLDATFHPDDICDLNDDGFWRARPGEREATYSFLNVYPTRGDGSFINELLVYRGGKLIVTDLNGDYKSDFVR